MRTLFTLIGAILILTSIPAILQAETLNVRMESTTGHVVSGSAAVEVQTSGSWYLYMASNYRYDGEDEWDEVGAV